MRVPARKNYQTLRIQLLRRGINLRRWALRNKLPVGSVYNAVKGLRNGAGATRIRSRLETFLHE